MKDPHKLPIILLLVIGFAVCVSAADVAASIEQIQTDGQLLLKVPNAGLLKGAQGEVYYTVVAEGASRDVVVGSIQVAQVVNSTHVLARLIQSTAPVQTSFKVRLTPTPIPAEKFLENMVYVPGGTATIGLDRNKAKFWNETPAHPYNLEPYYIERTEVTIGQYAKFVQETDHRLPPGWEDDTPPVEDEPLPVTGVTWEDAMAYSRWALRRLPSEQEWEWAGRTSRSYMFPWGNDFIKNYANTEEADRNHALPVISFATDLSQFGVSDLAGNVAEWTLSVYRPYPGNTHDEEYNPDHYVVRGGAFTVKNKYCRLPFRASKPNNYHCSDVGFRTAISIRELDKLIAEGLVAASPTK